MKTRFTNGFSESAVATILKSVIQALLYLHERHIIHKYFILILSDLKADNIVIEPTGEVRLGGFRQLRDLQKNGQINKSVFTLVGDNIEWAAPEVILQGIL
jgi:serine/threonine protein kinase